MTVFCDVNEGSLPLLVDLYELTMCDAYVTLGRNDVSTFDLFVRKLPKERGFLVAAGLSDALDYVTGLKFGSEAVSFLESLKKFSPAFLSYLEKFKFGGDVWAMPEGTAAFAGEPMMRVTAPLAEAQLLETMLLNCVGFQTLIASKAARIVCAARGRPVSDFSLRRTHGGDAGMTASRASYIAGFAGTSNVLAGKEYGIPLMGTVAHSFILSYATELDAFRALSEMNPDNCILLIDTYDTVEGARNAVAVGRELAAKGHRLAGVRIDSGDPLLLSRRVRNILDDGGLQDAKIFLSGNLNEREIERVLANGVPIDSFGVGTSVGVSDDAPSLDIIFKLAEARIAGRDVPVMKMSEGKATLPGKKQVFRSEEAGAYAFDVIALEGEAVPGKPLLEKFVSGGRIVRPPGTITEARARALESISKIPASVKQLASPGGYSVKQSPLLTSLIDSLKKKWVHL